MRGRSDTPAAVRHGGLALLAGLLLALVSACSASINQYLLIAQKGDIQQAREAIVGIGEKLHEMEAAGYRFGEGELQAVAFLKDVALAHPDPISRMEALSALARLNRPDADHVFLETLDDEHFGVRWEAAKALTRHPDPRASRILAERLEVEPKPEVRIDLIKGLIAVGDRVALKVLLEIFLEGQRGRYLYNQLTAYEGIRRISGLDHGFEEKSAWKEFYDREFAAEVEDADKAPPAAVPSAEKFLPDPDEEEDG